MKFTYTTYGWRLNWALWSFFMLVDAMKQHLEEKILNPIRRKLTLRPKRPIVFFITQCWNEKCRKWHFREPRFKIFCKSMLLDSLLWTVLSSRAFTLKTSRYTWRMSTSRRNRNKFTIIPTSATLKNTNVLTIHRRSDGGAVISFIATYMHCMRPQSLLDVIYITTTLIKPLSHWQRRIF